MSLWSALSSSLTSSLERVYEVLDAPVNMLTGDTDEPSVEDTGETASGDVVDTTTQPLAQSDITAETATEAVAASSGDSAAAAAPGQQQGKFIVLSALESVYSEGMKMADSSLEASKKALNDIRRDVETSTALYQGLELGESLLASSLSVLETVGKNAVDVIVQERNKARQQQQQHGQPESPQQQQQQASPSVASPLVAVTPATTTTTAKAPGNGKRTFAKQFEDVGMGHLQALEMLASTADAKFHSLSNSATPEKLASAEKILKTLNFEHDEAEIEAAEELLLVLPAGSSHLESIIAQLGLSVLAPSNDMRVVVTNAVHLFHTVSQITSPPNSASDLALVSPRGDKRPDLSLSDVQQDAVVSLAAFSGKACEQLLRIAEHLLIAPVPPTDAADKIRDLVMLWLKELSCLTSKYEHSVQALGDHEGKADAASDLSNGILVDGSDALFHLQDAAKHIASILRASSMS